MDKKLDLEYYLKLESWKWKEGLPLLTGVSPKNISSLLDDYIKDSNHKLESRMRECRFAPPRHEKKEVDKHFFYITPNYEDKHIPIHQLKYIAHELEKVIYFFAKDFLNINTAAPPPYNSWPIHPTHITIEPQEFISWAVGNGITPPWLNWAIEQRSFM